MLSEKNSSTAKKPKTEKVVAEKVAVEKKEKQETVYTVIVNLLRYDGKTYKKGENITPKQGDVGTLKSHNFIK